MTPNPAATCEGCNKPFVRRSSLVRVCGAYRCAVRVLNADKREARDDFKRRKEAAKPRQKLMAEAKQAFHLYVRTRDYGKPCICCGKPMPWHESTPGGYIDAGHYMGTGACPELRFTETNVSAQLKSCNRPGGTTRASFRAGMIKRWGLAEVEWLEGPHKQTKHSVDDLRAIRDEYRAKLKAMQSCE